MVDWAGIIWALVERELLDARISGRCYYGLHLQRLIMHQRPDLFESTAGVRPQPEVVVDDEDGNMACDNFCNGESDGTNPVHCASELNVPGASRSDDVSAIERGGIVALTAVTCDLEEFEGVGLNSGLSSEGNTMLCLTDSDSCGEEEQHCLADTKGTGTRQCQQLCSLNDVTDTKCGDVERSAEEYANEDPRVMEDPSAGALLDAEAQVHEKMEVCPILDRRGSKRKINEADVKENGDNEPLPTIDECLEQVQCWMDTAKVVHVKNEQACINLRSEVQYLSNMLQQKEQVIRILEKEKMKEEEKRKLEASQFEHDLKHMSSLVHGCEEALRKTRKKFAEYTKESFSR